MYLELYIIHIDIMLKHGSNTISCVLANLRLLTPYRWDFIEGFLNWISGAAFNGFRTPERRRCTERAAPSVRPASASGDWQRRRRLDLLHREARSDVLERHRADQALVERVVALNVGHHDAQHVVDVARHPVEFHHLRH